MSRLDSGHLSVCTCLALSHLQSLSDEPSGMLVACGINMVLRFLVSIGMLSQAAQLGRFLPEPIWKSHQTWLPY